MGKVGPLEDLIPVREGLAELLVPRGFTRKGPGRVAGRPFYNAAMALPRHVSVLVLRAVAPHARRLLDGLASTGVLGIRAALEVTARLVIRLNDRRPESCALIEKNARRHGLEDLRISCQDLNALLSLEHFDYVDVDPFGSPAPFVDSALRSLGPRGFLALTATDTAVLAGTYPKTCRRRYDAVPVKAPFSHEVGVRILDGFVVRMAARYDLAARPLLSMWRGHAYKVFFRLESGGRKADEALRHLGHVEFAEGRERRVGPAGSVGPLWAGPLHDASLVAGLRAPAYMPAEVDRLVETWREEAEAPPLFFTSDEIARHLRTSPLSMAETLRRLREAGFAGARTSFHPKGFKTDAPWAEVTRLLRPA